MLNRRILSLLAGECLLVALTTAPMTPPAHIPANESPRALPAAALSAAPSAAGDAELPRVYLNTAVSATPSAGRTIAVPAGGNLQAAFDSARPGDRITLAACAQYRGNFSYGPSTGGIAGQWITVQSAGQLPAEGTRVSPAMAKAMCFPKIVSTSATSTLISRRGASRWRFIGLEITVDSARVPVSQGLILAGDASSAQNSVASIPSDIIIDRVYAHGNVTTDLRKCVAMNAARVAVIDSYLSECHSAFDAQAITGTNGPGPYKIVNNYLEGAAENIGFGGAVVHVPNLVQADIEIRRNYLSKPIAWRGKWNTKTLIEFKDARRVLIEGNVMENQAKDSQAGFAIVLWSATAGCSWCILEDVTVRNNLIRNVAGGFSLSTRYDATTLAMRRVTIRNNLLIGVDNPAVASNGRLFQMQDTITNLTIEHNTAFSPSNASFIWGGAAPLTNHVIRDNLIGGGDYMLFAGTAGKMGAAAWDYVAGPGSMFSGNVVALAQNNGTVYPTNGFYPTTLDEIGLAGGATAAYSVTATIDDMALSAGSAFKRKGTDGKDPGADIAALKAAIAGVKP